MDSRRRSSASEASVEKTEIHVGNDTIPIILKNTDSVDRISKLPDDIIEHIFSFLTPRDVLATHALSKTWVRYSPLLKLSPKHFLENKAVELFESYKKQGVRVKAYSLNIPNPYKYSTCIENWLQLVAENDIYVLCIRFGFIRHHFSFSFRTALSNNLVVLNLQNCSVVGLTFSSKLHSLEELILDNVELPVYCESFVSSFYNIRKLRLKNFCNFYHLCFKRLERLEKVEIRSRYSINHRKRLVYRPLIYYDRFGNYAFINNFYCYGGQLSFMGCNNLETLWLHASILPVSPKEKSFPDLSIPIDFPPYRETVLYDYILDLPEKELLPKLYIPNNLPRLKNLSLQGKFQMEKRFRIKNPTLEVLHLGMEDAIFNTDRWQHTFHQNILLPRFYISRQLPRLKGLFLHGKFKMEKMFRVEHPALLVLHLSYVDGIDNAIINTPGLHTFKFAGRAFESFLFAMKIGACLRKISLEFHESCPIDAIWFFKLRLFVKNLCNHELVLSLHITNVVYFICKSLGKFRRPVCKIKHIKVKDLRYLSPFSCKDLLNGILSGFRPETLTLVLANDLRECIEVIQKHLQNKKGSTYKCCSSVPFRCWRHDMKRAEIELSSMVSKKIPFNDLVEINIKFMWGED